MKGLSEYINEKLSIEINESNEKWFRFTTKEYDDESIVSTMKSKASEAGFYVENIDYGIKIRLDADKTSKLSSLVEWLESYIEDHKDDEKKADLVEKVQKVVDEMKEDIEDYNEQETKKEEEEAKKKEEEEKKAEEGE